MGQDCIPRTVRLSLWARLSPRRELWTWTALLPRLSRKRRSEHSMLFNCESSRLPSAILAKSGLEESPNSMVLNLACNYNRMRRYQLSMTELKALSYLVKLNCQSNTVSCQKKKKKKKKKYSALIVVSTQS